MKDVVKPAELSTRLGDEIESVVWALGLRFRRSTGWLRCYSPWTLKKVPKLDVDIAAKPGRWKCWETGHEGDALGLVGCLLTAQPDMRTHAARVEGIRWARDRYGLTSDTFDKAAWAASVEAAKERQKEAAKKAQAEARRFRDIANAVWINAEVLRPTSRTEAGLIVPGCDGARYLEARGIEFARLGRLPRAIRFSPDETWKDPKGEAEDHTGPALVSAMTRADGSFACIHRIWIDPTRPGEKAPLDPPRKMWPSSHGAAIRLWRGEGGLSEADAEKRGKSGPLVVCEGVEDGLSIALMTPEFRVHAAGSLSGLMSYDPPACASEIIVAADNDWNTPTAMDQLARAIERLKGMGRPVKVVRSPIGKDFNDLLRGVA
jgi:phage/plasmid primase-like uncharacterized protein